MATMMPAPGASARRAFAPNRSPGLGPVLKGRSCSFRVWAPNASAVRLIGTFTHWDQRPISLQPGAEGVWSIEVDGVTAGDEYQYLITNKGGDEWNPGTTVRRTDPYARRVHHSNGAAIVVDVAGERVASGLATDPFRTPRACDLIGYELHIGSFVGRNDGTPDDMPHGGFGDLIDRLGYIRDLGFNALMLLPHNENPGDGPTGYSPAHWFAPETSYGTPLDFRRLVRAAHDHGMAVVADVVFNHGSPSDNSLWEFDGMTRDGGIYFADTSDTPWGSRPAHHVPQVQRFFRDNIRMLFEEYGVDGIRFDAADEVSWEAWPAILGEFRADPRWTDRLFIAEWSGEQMDRWPAVHGDLGFDFLWALGDPFTWREGVDAGAVDPSRRATRLAELISGYGLSLEAALVRYPLGSHDNILEQHNGDTPAQRHFVEWAGGRLDWYAQAKARMGWSLATVLPGLPMMFMGAECHHAGYWAPAPDANPVWNDHRFDWGQVADETGRAMLAFVRGANKLRWAHPALRGPWTELLHVDPTNAVVAFQRTAEGEEPCVIVVNASDGEWRDTPYQVPVAGLDGAWRPVFDSHLDWPDAVAGHGAAPVVQGVLAVPVPRWSVVMLVREAAA